MLGWLRAASARPSSSKRRSRSGRAGGARAQNLDRYLAPEPRVSSAIHLAHASRAKERDDLVRAEP